VPPATPGEFARIAIGLLDRVDLPPRTRYRLAGLGLANFRDEHDIPPALFA
jgi:DNA polymerase-4